MPVVTCSAAQSAHTALELAIKAVVRVRADPGDTAGRLERLRRRRGCQSTACHKQSTRQGLPMQRRPGVGGNRPPAASSPVTAGTDPVGYAVVDLVPPGHRVQACSALVDDPDGPVDFSLAAGVRQIILVLVLGWNALPSQAASAARSPADRTA